MQIVRNTLIVAALSVASTSSITLAGGPDFDLSPFVGPGNQIALNAYQDDLQLEVENVRVFAYEFGEEIGQPFFLPDPGFHPLRGSGFTTDSLVGFQLTAPLSFWNGVGSVGPASFGALPNLESISLGFGPGLVVVSGATVPSPAGYNFGVIDAFGEFDDHLETYLLGAGGTTLAPGAPTAGIYLLSLRVTSSTPGVLASETAYLLFANGEFEEQLDEAKLFVRDTFAPGTNLAVVPEPAALSGVLLLAAFAASRSALRGRVGKRVGSRI